MTDRQWKRLLRGIQLQRCILLLGPMLDGTLANGQWYPLSECFSDFLSKELEAESLSFDPDYAQDLSFTAQLFLHIEGVKRIDLEDEARDFYQQETQTIPPIYHQLASLPFSLVINANCDDYMVRAFNNVGKMCRSAYYNFKRQVDFTVNPEQLNEQHPLVYNLYGSLDKPESLVLTAEDQVEFIRNVIKSDPGIPNAILEQFDQSKSYLFLGFNLEHWQLRLLVESLNLKEGNTTHTPKVEKYPYSQPTQVILEQRYKFHFIEKNIREFTNELLEKLEEEREETEKIRRQKRKLFIAYADEDLNFATQMDNFLKPLEDKNELEVVFKKDISVGQDFAEVIKKFMTDSDVILLLLSADFLANDKIKDLELKLAIEKHQSGQATVIPIIARACDWKSNDYLSTLAPLPVNGVPITNQSWSTLDDAFNHIIKYLKRRLW